MSPPHTPRTDRRLHGPPAGPEYPALQTQSVAASLPAGESELSGHVLQACVPALSYVPAPHREQASPLSPLYPALHTQAVTSVLSEGVSALASHASQAADPGDVLYVPAAQAAHAPPSAPV